MKNLLLFLVVLLTTFKSAAQDSTNSNAGKELVIGITETPPFIVHKNGRLTGISISSWELVNEKLEADYRYKVFPSLDSLLKAVENGTVDLSINPITVTDQRMRRIDFSQPYFISHTAIAKKDESKIWKYISNILSWNFISAILILVGVIFIFGFLVWLFERKANQDQFHQGGRGIFQGFWWSAVTMTTVGYGDKSPRTFGGRFVGLIWMFMAIIMISSLTAGIASSLTVQNMHEEINSVQDLEKFEVITVQSSSAQELLDQYGIASSKVLNSGEGFESIARNNDVLFVYDQPILNYYIAQNSLKDKYVVLPKMLKKDYYSYSFPKGSTLVKKIDPILVATLKTMEWNNLIKDYQ